jgi:hypothetical protein
MLPLRRRVLSPDCRHSFSPPLIVSHVLRYLLCEQQPPRLRAATVTVSTSDGYSASWHTVNITTWNAFATISLSHAVGITTSTWWIRFSVPGNGALPDWWPRSVGCFQRYEHLDSLPSLSMPSECCLSTTRACCAPASPRSSSVSTPRRHSAPVILPPSPALASSAPDASRPPQRAPEWHSRRCDGPAADRGARQLRVA